MATNLLSLPLLQATFETATNESWRDGVAFTTAGSVTSVATAGNSGNGSLSGLTVASGAYVGDYSVTLTGPTTFQVSDPDGYIVGSGVLGVSFQASGIGLTLNVGQAPFVNGDSFTLTVLPQPIDITGIRFMMTMRATATSTPILVSGDTAANTMVNGGASGILGFAIPVETMRGVTPSPDGAPYVLDVLALADGDQRRCVAGTNAVVLGITFPTG